MMDKIGNVLLTLLLFIGGVIIIIPVSFKLVLWWANFFRTTFQ